MKYETYKVLENVYLIVNPFDNNLKKNSPEAPFLGYIIWTPDFEIIREYSKVRMDNYEYKDIQSPSEMCFGTSGTYLDIINGEAMKNEEVAHFGELKDSNNIVYQRTISLGTFIYFYLPFDDFENKFPFLILVRT